MNRLNQTSPSAPPELVVEHPAAAATNVLPPPQGVCVSGQACL